MLFRSPAVAVPIATGGLGPAEIAAPLRSLFRKQPNLRVLCAEVVDIDPAQQTVSLHDGHALRWDYLVVAAGASNNYFGNDSWAAHAPGLKTVEDAQEIRRRVLSALETAERIDDPHERTPWLTFVVVGGGPTGVEMAGAWQSWCMSRCATSFGRLTRARRGFCCWRARRAC